jgi:hypothetical protein
MCVMNKLSEMLFIITNRCVLSVFSGVAPLQLPRRPPSHVCALVSLHVLCQKCDCRAIGRAVGVSSVATLLPCGSAI